MGTASHGSVFHDTVIRPRSFGTGDTSPLQNWVNGHLATFLELDSNVLLDSHSLAKALDVSQRTLRRMIQRGQITAGIRISCQPTWLVGKAIDFFNGPCVAIPSKVLSGRCR